MAFLTPQGVKNVFQLQKPEGREHLRRLLDWEKFDEVRDSRRSILLDTLYESIIFAVGKGFPWVEVVEVVKFTDELLKETKVSGVVTHPRSSLLVALVPEQVLASRGLGTIFRKFPAANANEGHSLLLKNHLQELENLINEAIHIQIKCLKELLQYEIQTTFDILDLKLQKKTLNLNAPIPFPLSISGQLGQDESLKINKARKAKKAKGKKESKD
ncbi:PREDICTED: uncharacterized protein C8orf74 homolog [Myotis brandtii]|uniref:uncharacterized protein C8orf74 homolog n=1 Tax=Myotis brandtii TaxID=109478 RepID=UPI0003BBF469|nr:PREDICTED: uncharacterized protein C8orf74 homolog [Myotis brandtii]